MLLINLFSIILSIGNMYALTCLPLKSTIAALYDFPLDHLQREQTTRYEMFWREGASRADEVLGSDTGLVEMR